MKLLNPQNIVQVSGGIDTQAITADCFLRSTPIQNGGFTASFQKPY